MVLYLDPDLCQSWDRDEVIRRWRRLFRGDPLACAYLRGEVESEAQLAQLDARVAIWRERLCDLSWFMRCLNEYLARRANAEDECTGRFWEGRFKCQALVDDAALLSCMAYVDLNPVRAGLCGSLGESDFTSIQVRLREIAATGEGMEGGVEDGIGDGNEVVGQTCEKPVKPSPVPVLMPFRAVEMQDKVPSGNRGPFSVAALPFSLKDYVALVDWTGRIARLDKKGVILGDAPGALSAIGLSPEQWRVLALDIQRQAIVMFNGLDRLTAWERKTKLAKRAA